MRIEEEIQSTNFEDIYHKAVINVSYTYGWLNNTFRCKFEKHKLTSQQFNVLRILRGQYPNAATVNLIKERMIDKMSDASRIVDRLVEFRVARSSLRSIHWWQRHGFRHVHNLEIDVVALLVHAGGDECAIRNLSSKDLQR